LPSPLLSPNQKRPCRLSQSRNYLIPINKNLQK